LEYFIIGKIVNTQGIKGHVRVVPQTDDIKRFELLKSISVFVGEHYEKSFDIEAVSYHKSFVILKLKDINDMTAAERLKGYLIKIQREQALPLKIDEYYISDLYGMTVITENGEQIGEISDVILTGANDVYTVTAEGQKDVLIPAVKQYINSVDVEKRVVVIHNSESLINNYRS
jgi:16S rRNA processing protein RimM